MGLCFCLMPQLIQAQQFINGKIRYRSEYISKKDLEYWSPTRAVHEQGRYFFVQNIYTNKLIDAVKKESGFDIEKDPHFTTYPKEILNSNLWNYGRGMFPGMDTIASDGNVFISCILLAHRRTYDARNINYLHRDSLQAIACMHPSLDTLFSEGWSFELNNKLIKDSNYRLNFLLSQNYMPNEKLPNWVLYNFSNNPAFNTPITLNFVITVSISASPQRHGDTIYSITRKDMVNLVEFEGGKEQWTIYNSLNANYAWWKMDIPFKATDTAKYIVFTAHVTNMDSPAVNNRSTQLSSFTSGPFRDHLKLIKHPFDVNGYIVSRTVSYGPIMLTDLSLSCPGVQIQGDSLLCVNNKAPQLHATGIHPSDRFLWSTGDTTASIPIQAPGVYWVARDRMGCMGYDTVRVEMHAGFKPAGSSDTLACQGEGITLGANRTQPGLSYSWNTGDTGCCLYGAGAGVYVRSHGAGPCQSFDTFRVQYHAKPIAVNPHVYTPCEDSIFDINSRITPAAWFNRYGDLLGETNTLYHRSNQAEPLYLRTQTPHCTYYDTLQIRPIFCGQPKPIWVPNAFTPEGNNLNELFTFTAAGWELEDMQIYNRWGELLYRGNSGWDGLHRNKPAPEGVYIYHLKLYHPATNTRTYRNGSFHLLR
jgi:gliding motility-associated-like protein